MTQQKTRKRTTVKRKQPREVETDGQYLLKLVLVVLLGSFWLRFGEPIQFGSLAIAAIPVGVFIGIGFISYFEHFQSDRKIWYAVLILMGIATAFAPTGVLL